MKKENHFSKKLSKMSSEALKAMINDVTYTTAERTTAIWELENRNEATPEFTNLADELYAQKVQAALPQNEADKYRTFSARFIASFVDGFALAPLSFVALLLADTDYRFFDYAYPLIDTALIYGYSILLHGFKGQTLGKMAMGIKVVNFKDETDITMKQAFKRDLVPLAIIILFYTIDTSFFIAGSELTSNYWNSIYYFVGILPLLWTVLEITTMLTNKKSRALHDFIAGTVVIKIEEGA
jgi:uncharacterized RDD family membrane protein YckC